MSEHDEPVEVSADRPPFAMIPNWLLTASSHAYRLYGLLHSYADNTSREAWPSRATLARQMGMAKAGTLQPYIKELEDLGAITVIRSTGEDGTNRVNRYRLHQRSTGVGPSAGPPPASGVSEGSPLHGGRPVDGPRGGPVSGPRVGPSAGPKLEPLNLEPVELEPLFSTEPADAAPAQPPAEPPTEDGPNTNTLLKLWLDHCPAKPPQRVIGQMAREIKALLDEGIAYDHVSNGLAEWHRRGEMGPSALPSFVNAVMQRQAVAPAMPNTAPAPSRGTPRVATADRNIQDTLSLLSPEYRAQMELGANRPAGELEA
ncbi:HTH DNA binding domain protein [Arthrobacter phage Salgado]|uniref:HTH DNA binding domain protein n=1 Tax=Arthrobacter phage Salgado TaxID=1772314 RepID=A0A0U4B6B5_9CAUD|nr:transcriptional repressor [Arthrobacter phage Salgado]ALY10254.1 HTH DNA binding domain protein [Arthrobacter phage Salgado]